MTFDEYLKESAVPKEVATRFPQGPSWTRFHPELRCILGNYVPNELIKPKTRSV